LCREPCAYLDGGEVGQKVHELVGAQLRCPHVRSMLAKTVAIAVAGVARCRVVLSEDRRTDRATVALQDDVLCRPADVLVVVVQVQRERQPRAVAQSPITQELLCRQTLPLMPQKYWSLKDDPNNILRQ